MKTAKMNRTRTTVTANKYLAYPAYVSARDLATAHDGTIDTTADKLFTAKFPTATHAKAFVQAWTTAYEKACDDKATATASVPAPAPKRTRKGKGNSKAVDFGKVKGATKSDRNKAAHTLIVSTGVKSGSDEYKALWNEWTSVR